MDIKELATLFFNHRHSGTHPDARKLNIKQIIGVAGSTAMVLISPNGTRYMLGVDDDGALTTEIFSGHGALYVTSPGGNGFMICVGTDGVPTTAPYSGAYGHYEFATKIVLTDSLGNNFDLEVLDDGTIITSPA